MNDKISSVLDELDRLSADLSLMLSRVAAMRQTVEFLGREMERTDNERRSRPEEAAIDPEVELAVEEEMAEAENEAVSGESGNVPMADSGPELSPDVIADDDAEVADADSEVKEAASEDLRKMFTINDRYRFRRELFGNDNILMTDTINLIAAMASYAEVEDYVYSDLEWDRENEDVKAFMDIVAFRFSKRY